MIPLMTRSTLAAGGCAVFIVVAATTVAALDLNPFSAIKNAVEAALEDRGTEDIAADTKIKASILADVISTMGSDVISINADVYEQEVMLTGAVENFVDDTLIESKINALLLDGKGVNVTNFRWRAVGGRGFFFGRALSAAERDKASTIVKGIDKVTSVTSRVKVRPKR